MSEPAQVEWPSDWDNWGKYDPAYISPIKAGNPIYDDCPFDCERGWLPAPDESASACPHCMNR